MVGTWRVQQRMWPAGDVQAIALPPALARRRLVGQSFLEETMELAPGSKEAPFTRLAYFNYNAVNQQYEYVSMDTRALQMMNEKSADATADGPITLYGGSFVAPAWGDAKNAGFRYRRTIAPIAHDSQTVRLYLTPQSAANAREFLAFEYLYARQR